MVVGYVMRDEVYEAKEELSVDEEWKKRAKFTAGNCTHL